MERGVVYAFIGVVGSGKTFRMEQLAGAADLHNVPYIKADFSDGIRDTLMNIFTGSDKTIDLLSETYSEWKNSEIFIPVPYPTPEGGVYVSGRQFLQNTAEFLKELAGEEVWATYTAKKIIKEYYKTEKRDERKAKELSIMFGSVRFPAEIAAVFTVAEATGKEVRFIFCDFHSHNYSPAIDHISEQLAQRCIAEGFSDGENITSFIAQYDE